jgi:hypothetical protein
MTDYVNKVVIFWNDNLTFRIAVSVTFITILVIVVLILTYNIDGTTGWFGSCVDCPAGSFGSTSGATICTQCKPGTYTSSEGFSECEQCPDTKYTYKAGQTSCEQCPTQQVSNEDYTGCQTCPPGKFADENGDCIECEKGTFSEDYDSDMCTKCEPESTTRFASASTEDACIPKNNI